MRRQQSPDVIEIRITGTRGMIDKFLADMQTPPTWAIGPISQFYEQRNGMWAVYITFKRMP